MGLEWLDLDPIVGLAKYETLIVERVGAFELGADGHGSWIRQGTPTKAGIQRGETIEVMSCDCGRVLFEAPGPGGADRVAKTVDEDLAVSWFAISPRRDVIQGLVRSAYPAALVVPNCADAI